MEQRPEDGKWKYSNRQQVGQSIAGNAFLESQDSLWKFFRDFFPKL